MTDERKQIFMHRKRKRKLTPAQFITLGFLGVMLVGTFLLCLPISARNRQWLGFLDGIFMAASAISTTGLLVVSDTALHFSAFGQVVLLILIQFGGVGFMCIATLIMLLLRRKITLSGRLLMKAEFNQDDTRGMVRLGRNMMLVTLAIEGVGFLLLLFPFVHRNGAIGAWQALFTSVSAFCNAGFDVMGVTQGAGSSLTAFAGNVTVNLATAFLIILGGLGFTVLMDLGRNKCNFSRLSVHSKVVLITSAALIFAGWFFYLGAEWSNKATLGSMRPADRVLAAFFQSVTPRSTGFATITQTDMTHGSKLMTMVLMFVGASPASTGGGIRTSTLAILILVTVAGIRGSDDIVVFRHSVSQRNARKAVSVFVTSFTLILVATLILFFSERGHAPDDVLTLENVLFETISAYTTAGLTCGIISTISNVGKIVLTFLMFFGRVGIITIGLLFVQKNDADSRIRYPESNIMIG